MLALNAELRWQLSNFQQPTFKIQHLSFIIIRHGIGGYGAPLYWLQLPWPVAKFFSWWNPDIYMDDASGKASNPANPLKIDGSYWNPLGSRRSVLKLIGILSLFIGFMNIAEKAGGIRLLSRIVGPFFSRLFQKCLKGHPAHGHMIMNFRPTCLVLIMPQHHLV